MFKFDAASVAVVVLSVTLSRPTSAQPQLPNQAMAISKQCKPYTGTVCAGVVDYEYLGKEKDDGEDTVKAALKKVEARMTPTPHACFVRSKCVWCLLVLG